VVNLVANGDMEEIGRRPAGGLERTRRRRRKVERHDDEKVFHGGKRSLHFSGEGDWIAAGSAMVRLNQDLNYKAAASARVAKGRPCSPLPISKRHVSRQHDQRGSQPGDNWVDLSMAVDGKQYPRRPTSASH